MTVTAPRTTVGATAVAAALAAAGVAVMAPRTTVGATAVAAALAAAGVTVTPPAATTNGTTQGCMPHEIGGLAASVIVPVTVSVFPAPE